MHKPLRKFSTIALAAFSLFINAQVFANEVITPLELNKLQYGTGDNKLLFNWQKNSSTKNYEFFEADNEESANVTFKYLTATSLPRLDAPTPDEVIEGNFQGLTLTQTGQYVYGAAIYNKNNNIQSITGDFIQNGLPATTWAYGGAIYNEAGTIGKIKGNFVKNYIETKSSYGRGGAINNTIGGDIQEIEGSFIANNINTKSSYAYGGAIFNGSNTSTTTKSKIGSIKGDFVANNVTGGSSYSEGGAIYNKNSGEITSIEGNFIGNYAKNTYTGSAGTGSRGGAIYNENAKISSIKGDFINNYTYAEKIGTSGGAVYNTSNAQIDSIEGKFISNKVDIGPNNTNSSGGYGGAIHNLGAKIGSIKGEFTDNSVTYYGSTYGGAISANYESASIDSIEGVFKNNHTETLGSSPYSSGGAIYTYNSPIGEIRNSSFYNNYAKSNSLAFGGAIYSATNLNIIADNGEISEYIGNYTDSNGVIAQNAIYLRNTAFEGENFTPLNLTFKTTNNSRILFEDTIDGSHPYNLDIQGDGTGIVSFYNDVNQAYFSAANTTVDFANGAVKDYEFLSFKSDATARYSIDIDLLNGKADRIKLANPTSSKNTVTLSSISFINKYQGSPLKVQILDVADDNTQLELDTNIVTIADIDNIVYNNMIIEDAGAISLDTTLTTNDSVLINGRIYDTLDAISSKTAQEERSFVFRTNDTYNVSSDLSPVTSGVLNIEGIDKENSIINGNKNNLFKLSDKTTLNLKNVKVQNAASVVKGEVSEASVNISNSKIVNNDSAIETSAGINIYGGTEFSNNGEGIIALADSLITLDATDGLITINDKLQGSKVLFQNGNIDLYKEVNVNDINLNNAYVNFKNDEIINNKDINILTNSTMSFANNKVSDVVLNSLTLNSNANFEADVDLANLSMDRLSANNYNLNGFKLNVSKMNLLSDATDIISEISFADEFLKDSITTSIKEVSYSPIYKYSVEYDETTGKFLFTRGGGYSNKTHNAFNPSILASSVAAQLGGYLTQLTTYDEAFKNMDMYMLMPKKQREAIKCLNKYASTDAKAIHNKVEGYPKDNGSGWFRPYTIFENVPLKHGPKVSNVAYGSYFGAETSMYDYKNGFSGIGSVYFSYNGSHQAYSGNDIYQNGGTFGMAGMLYKGNFFTGLTANVGGMGARANTKYGNEDFGMFMTGVANKSGYNFEFLDGKFIIQPNYMIAYSLVNTFNYTNANGIHIASPALNAITIEPGVKFIGNFKNGIQPYLGASFVWNIIDKTMFKAQDVTLAQLSVKPYVKYGLGLQKGWGKRFTGFIQTYLTHGGRNGIGLQAGCNIELGE